MGYDWELIDRLDHEAHRRAKTYRCPFIEAVQSTRHGGPSFRNDSFVRAALGILAFREDVGPWVGDPIRGEVHKREAVNRPPPYHYKPVHLRGNVLVGEFTAR